MIAYHERCFNMIEHAFGIDSVNEELYARCPETELIEAAKAARDLLCRLQQQDEGQFTQPWIELDRLDRAIDALS